MHWLLIEKNIVTPISGNMQRRRLVRRFRDMMARHPPFILIILAAHSYPFVLPFLQNGYNFPKQKLANHFALMSRGSPQWTYRHTTNTYHDREKFFSCTKKGKFLMCKKNHMAS